MKTDKLIGNEVYMADEINLTTNSIHLLKVEDVAERLNISPSLVYQMMQRNEIPYVRIGKRSVRMLESDLIEYILKSRMVEKHVFMFGAKINE
jgi:excisionase family DNA binding protein